MPDKTAIKKLKTMLDDKTENVVSLAKKLGIARGTLLGILSGRTQPRLDVMVAAQKIGIKQTEWTT
jgi:predicted transcriptional regulator